MLVVRFRPAKFTSFLASSSLIASNVSVSYKLINLSMHAHTHVRAYTRTHI